MATPDLRTEEKRRLIVVGPLPPPIHGVAESTRLVLGNPALQDRFSISHLDTSDHRPLSTIERWDATNILVGLRSLFQLTVRLRGRKGVVYLPLSQGLGGFARDSLFIHVAATAGWKVAAHLRGSAFRDFYERSHPFVRWWMRATLARVASVGVLGPRVKQIFDGLVPPERLAVVPNGTPDVRRDGASREPARVLFLSNFLEGKGIVEALETARIVVSRNSQAEVVFAGQWMEPKLEARLRDRIAAAERVRFIPPVTGDEKERLLQSCAVLLFPPKHREGHPRILLEAICRGIPVVTTSYATLTDTVSDGDGAFVLAEPDPEVLADRVLQLLEDSGLRERMGRDARARYEARFTQQHADRRLADWLSGLVA
jgi:glycosyltransferase involved in cell wall biosynthesis